MSSQESLSQNTDITKLQEKVKKLREINSELASGFHKIRNENKKLRKLLKHEHAKNGFFLSQESLLKELTAKVEKLEERKLEMQDIQKNLDEERYQNTKLREKVAFLEAQLGASVDKERELGEENADLKRQLESGELNENSEVIESIAEKCEKLRKENEELGIAKAQICEIQKLYDQFIRDGLIQLDEPHTFTTVRGAKMVEIPSDYSDESFDVF